MTKIFLPFALSALLPVMAAAGNVGDSGVLTADSARVIDLDEVVVVAQPKEQLRLRRQPLSSTVFGERELHQLGVHDLSALSAYVPSFDMPAYGSRLTSSIYMRGTGTRMNAAAPSVPVYYDNMPLVSKSAFNTHFYMLDRVDVLRGPQATLYGMNSEGGLVRIYSKNPMNYQGTDIRLGVGSAFARTVEVAHYHRPTERLAFSAAGFYNGLDGFFTNDNLNRKNDKSNEGGGKLRLVWNATDRLTLDWTTDYQAVCQNAFPYAAYSPDDNDVKHPSTTFMNTYRRNMLNTGLNLRYRAESFEVNSTSTFQHLYDRMLMDQDYSAADRMALRQHQKQNAYTEEIAVRSRGKSRWQWATGVFASHQRLTTEAPVTFGPDMNRVLAQTILSAMPPRVQQMFSTWEIPRFGVAEAFKTPMTNVAVYHESNVGLTDRLTATVGVRLDHSHAKVSYDSQAALDLHYVAAMWPVVTESTNTLTDSLVGSTSKGYTQLLPKLGLTWQVDGGGSNVYAQVSKGYRVGGYNIQMFSDIMQTEMQAAGTSLQRGDHDIEHSAADYDNVNRTIEYEPETSWNYEVGAHLNLMGGRLHADAAAYCLLTRNQQLSVMAGNYGFGRMMVNAGRSRSLGVEAALRGSALDGRLGWAATYSYTHATFREYRDTVVTGGEKQAVDYRGKHVPYVPQHMFSVSADYRHDVSTDRMLRAVVVGANVAGRGKTFWNEENTARQRLYATVGAHVRLDMGCVDVDFWGRNLTDTRYCTFGLAYNDGYIGQRGLPLQVGVDVRMHL